MKETTGILKSLTVKHQGKTKKGAPFTIWGVEIQFPSGKSFTFSVPSWVGDLASQFQAIPLNTKIAVTTDDEKNITGVKILAAAPAETPEKGTDRKEPEKSKATTKKETAKIDPATAEINLKLRAVGLAITYYTAVLDPAAKKKHVPTDEDIVLDFAKKILKFVKGCATCSKVTEPLKDPAKTTLPAEIPAPPDDNGAFEEQEDDMPF